MCGRSLQRELWSTISVLCEAVIRSSLTNSNREASAHERKLARIATRSRLGKASAHPCFICGDTASDWDHFRGYLGEDRFRVIPVCRACHWKLVWARGEHHSPPSCTHGKGSKRHCRICKREVEARQRERNRAAGNVYRSPFAFAKCPHGTVKSHCKPCRNALLWLKRRGIAPEPSHKKAPINPDHIKTLAAQGFPQVDLAWAFGVTSCTISRIVNRKLVYAA